jgi:hypothetical protein
MAVIAHGKVHDIVSSAIKNGRGDIVVTDGLGLTCFSFSFLCDRYRSHGAVSSCSSCPCKRYDHVPELVAIVRHVGRLLRVASLLHGDDTNCNLSPTRAQYWYRVSLGHDASSNLVVVVVAGHEVTSITAHSTVSPCVESSTIARFNP